MKQESRIVTKQIEVKPEVNRACSLEPMSTAAKQTASEIQLDIQLDHIQMGSPIRGTSMLCSIVPVQLDNEEIVKPPHC